MTNTTQHDIIDGLYGILNDFASISLDELNATMSLMERIEKKYLVTLDDLWSIIKRFQKTYQVLSIKDNVIFNYDNIYMDTSDFLFFQLHENNSPKRTKIRTREYVESDLAFFEFKQREGDIVTKSRFTVDVAESKDITIEWKTFYQSMCAQLDLPYKYRNLRTSLRTAYKRITLCSKNNDERITIDFDIHIQDMRTPCQEVISFGPVAVVETKASKKETKSQAVLSQMWYTPANGCSKYCLWLLSAKIITKTKHFKESLQFIKQANKKVTNIKKHTKKHLKKTESQINAKLQHQVKITDDLVVTIDS